MTDHLTADDVTAWLRGFRDAFMEQRDELTELDRLTGDGDFGANMSVTLTHVAAGLDELETDDAKAVLRVAVRGFADSGGSSGPLLSAWFREVVRATGDRTVVGLDALARGAANGVRRINELGGAAVGDSTMVDAFAPAAEALVAAADGGTSLSSGLAAAAVAARAGAESTGDLVARRGRASYQGESSRHVLDPGAVAVAVLFEQAAQLRG